MDKPLTYPSLKCVLEYMEANKRIHICSRNPALRELERKIPLHLNRLGLDHSFITLNNITFQLHFKDRNTGEVFDELWNFDPSGETILFPGDIPTKSSFGWKHEEFTVACRKKDSKKYSIDLHFRNSLGQSFRIIQVPNYLEFHVAMKHLANLLLGARSMIYVKRLEVVRNRSQKTLRLPLGLKLDVRELEANSNQVEYLLPLINIKNLKEMRVIRSNWNDSCFDIPIVQSVQKLWITNYDNKESSWYKTLLKLPNREITYNGCPKIEMEELIQGLLDEGRNIGTCYMINESFRQYSSILEEFGKRFGRKVVKKYNNEKKNRPPTFYSISLPMTPASELSIRSTSTADSSHVRIEVVPITVNGILSVDEMDEISSDHSKSRFSTILTRILNRFGIRQS